MAGKAIKSDEDHEADMHAHPVVLTEKLDEDGEQMVVFEGAEGPQYD